MEVKQNVVLVLFDETDERTGRKTGRKLVSHGIDAFTFKTVTLPPVQPQEIGWFNQNIGEWMLKD